MAGGSLLTLLDDVATLLDDVATMTKVAAKKTAGVLGDDLALNAEQVNGVRADRELPVVWAVAVGSLKNKVILVPAALLISALAPWAITPLLMVGGLYLCFEGVEKLLHPFLAHDEAAEKVEHDRHLQGLIEGNVDLVALEKEKIQGAIRTDFVLSAEIIVIALGEVATKPLMTQFAVLASISLLMTVGVYGLVAGIVKLDDMGFWLQKRASRWAKILGSGLVMTAPKLMKVLTVVGTAAMFLVGGGILVHGIPALHHGLEKLAAEQAFGAVIPHLGNLLVGVVAGTVTLGTVLLLKKMRGLVMR